MPKKHGKMRGRPTSYTQAIGDEICERLADGESLRSICEGNPKLPGRGTVMRWLTMADKFERMSAEERDALSKERIQEYEALSVFSSQYFLARAEQAESLADDIVAISDESVACTDNAGVQSARLRVDARKWVASRILPKKYGDRITHDGAGEGGAIEIMWKGAQPKRGD